MYGVIYKITNLLNGKIYIGQTIQKLRERIRQHRKGKQYIDKVIQDCSWENFTVEVIEECETLEQLNEREIFWIAFFNCKYPNGYNLTDGGEGGSGRRSTPESLARMSAAQRKIADTPEGKARLDKARATRRENEKNVRPKNAAGSDVAEKMFTPFWKRYLSREN